MTCLKTGHHINTENDVKYRLKIYAMLKEGKMTDSFHRLLLPISLKENGINVTGVIDGLSD